jgi:hypothetical protein
VIRELVQRPRATQLTRDLSNIESSSKNAYKKPEQDASIVVRHIVHTCWYVEMQVQF